MEVNLSLKQQQQGQKRANECYQAKYVTIFCCFLVVKSSPALLWPCGLQPARPLSPWDFLSKNNRMSPISFSRESFQPGDQTHISYISCTGKLILYYWATREAQSNNSKDNKSVVKTPQPGFSGGSDGKEFACNVREPGSTPGLGRSLEKGMVTHSSILPWRIPWAEKLGGLQATGLQRVRHDWATITLTFKDFQICFNGKD